VVIIGYCDCPGHADEYPFQVLGAPSRSPCRRERGRCRPSAAWSHFRLG